MKTGKQDAKSTEKKLSFAGFLKKNSGRLSVALIALALITVFLLWDLGVLSLPFLPDRRERQTPGTAETAETFEVESIDYAAWAKSIAEKFYTPDEIENAYELVTSEPFSAVSHSLLLSTLGSGSFSASMGYVVEYPQGLPERYLTPDQAALAGSENYALSFDRDSDGNAVFYHRENGQSAVYDRAAGAFSPIEFDRENDQTLPALSLPQSYGGDGSGLTRFSENGLFGYTGSVTVGNKTRAVTVPAAFTTAFPYREGYAVCADEFGKVTILNAAGERVFTEYSLILPDFDAENALGFYYFDNGVLRVVFAEYAADGALLSKREGCLKLGVGKFDLPQGFEAVSYNEGVFVLTDGNRYGYYSATGAWITDPKYDWARPFCEGLAVVENEDGRYGLIDRNGSEILPTAWDALSDCTDGVIVAYSEGTGNVLFLKVAGNYSKATESDPIPEKSFYAKVTLTRGPANTFDHGDVEIYIFPEIVDPPKRTTHPEVNRTTAPTTTAAAPAAETGET